MSKEALAVAACTPEQYRAWLEQGLRNSLGQPSHMLWTGVCDPLSMFLAWWLEDAAGGALEQGRYQSYRSGTPPVALPRWMLPLVARYQGRRANWSPNITTEQALADLEEALAQS